MVDVLYSKDMLEGTKFLHKFENGMKVLNTIVDYDNSKSDAQALLRNIDNITVIPKCIYDENLFLFEQYEESIKNKDFKEKNRLRREISKLTLSIRNPKYKNDIKQYITQSTYIEKLYVADLEYSKEVGLKLENNIEYSTESRML
jgi:CRISPR-associated endonuclease/helicase Cas3